MSLADTYNNKLKDVFHIQVPDKNGNKQYVKRIYKNTIAKENIIWQLKNLTYTFRDNIPVTVYYNVNNTLEVKTEPPALKLNEQTMWLVPIGNVMFTNKILHNFSTANYARTPIAIDWTTTTSFELVLKIKTGTSVSTRQELFSMTNTESIELEVLNNRLHWEKYGKYGNTVLSVNTNYFVKVVKNLTSFKVYLSDDGVNYKLDIDSSANFNCTGEWMHFGIDKVCGGTTVEPFLGTMDLSQSTFLYGNVFYHISMQDDNYWQLLRGGNIKVDNNQVISGFAINKSLNTCAYAYSQNYINWVSTNTYTLCLHIKTGSNTTASQELVTWRDYTPHNNKNAYENWLKNDFAISSQRIWWEYSQTYASSAVIKPNTEYYIVFNRTKNIGYFEVFDAQMKSLSKQTVTKFPSDCKQYMYLGMDETSLVHYDWFSPSGHCVYTGVIYCEGSYVVLDNKKYKFRI